MPKRSSKDPNVTAFSIMQKVTGQDGDSSKDVSDALNDADLRRRLMQEMGRRGGQKGGKARAASMSPKKRKAIAKKAAEARWGGEKGKKG